MIKKLGPGKWRIDFHPGRHDQRVRRTIFGPRSLAETVLGELRKRALTAQFGWPEPSQTSVAELVKLVVDDYRVNRRKSLRSAQQLSQFWTEFVGGRLAENITGDMLKDWARDWIRHGLSPARCNRRITFLLRGYRLASASDPPKVAKIPTWTKLEESAPRSGFREWEDFVRIREALPLHARPVVTIEYWTGMRSGEAFSLQWTQIRFDHKDKQVRIQLAGKDTKTDEPRVVIMTGDLYETLRDWQSQSRNNYPHCPWVCHRKGRRIKTIKTAWKSACVKVGLGHWTKPNERYVNNRGYRGALMHDFRRTAIRNMVRAGVPEKVAMAISGHKTRAVFDRYNIVNERDLAEAAKKVVQHHQARHSKSRGGRLVDSPVSGVSQSPLQSQHSKSSSKVS